MWIQDQDYRDPDTGQMLSRTTLNTELEKLEKPAGISNPKDFRNEVVNFVLRARLKNGGENPKWTSYEKLKTVIEKRVFSSMEEVLPLLASGGKGGKENQQKYDDFVDRMKTRGYTAQQIPLVTDFYVKSL
jgi:serine protein kinase